MPRSWFRQPISLASCAGWLGAAVSDRWVGLDPIELPLWEPVWPGLVARALRRASMRGSVRRDRIIGRGIGRDASTGMTSFDHGAQYITARGQLCSSFLKEVENTGYAARWMAVASKGGDEGAGHFTPGMLVRRHVGRRSSPLA